MRLSRTGLNGIGVLLTVLSCVVAVFVLVPHDAVGGQAQVWVAAGLSAAVLGLWYLLLCVRLAVAHAEEADAGVCFRFGGISCELPEGLRRLPWVVNVGLVVAPAAVLVAVLFGFGLGLFMGVGAALVLISLLQLVLFT
ncbi:MAG: hypothetical protein ACYS1C_04240 [Planctomycetota bacterium]|jgi:hypothetical protein